MSKPQRGDAKVVFDGENVLVDGLVPDRNPIAQARAGRDWIRSVLEETTAIRFPVKAVVLFPGWYIVRSHESRVSDVWVLNEKALPAFIEHEQVAIKTEDVALAVSRLEDHVVRWPYSS